MSLWQWYVRSSPRTKAVIGGSIIAWGALGLAASDRAESMFGLTPSKEDEKHLQDQVDMLVPKITAVEKRKP